MSDPDISVDEALKQSFEQLWKLDEDELEVELGKRLELTRAEQARHAALSTVWPLASVPDSTELQGPLEVFAQVGRKFLTRLEKDMYSLICDKNDPDHAVIVKLGLDPKTIGLLLAGYLTAQLAILPGVAVALASLFAKRFVGTAFATACDEWKSRVAKASK